MGSGIDLYGCKLPGPIPHVLVQECGFRTEVGEMGPFWSMYEIWNASKEGDEKMTINTRQVVFAAYLIVNCGVTNHSLSSRAKYILYVVCGYELLF